MSKEPMTRTSLDRYADLFMGFGFVLLLLAATGWLVDKLLLASFNSAYVPMAPATLILFLGIWGTWFIRKKFPTREGLRRIIQAIQLGMLIIVYMLGIRSLTGLGPDLEKLISPNLPIFGQVSFARMSPLTALGFTLAVPSLFLLTRRAPGKRTRSISAALALALFFLNVLIGLGYLSGVPFSYEGTTIPVALTTAGTFLFLSLGLMLMVGPDCWPVSMYTGYSVRARLMRAIIPASIVIALFLGFLRSSADTWILSQGLDVAVAVFAACTISALIILHLLDKFSKDIERGRQSEAKLHALFNSMQDVVIIYDMDGRYLEIAPTNPVNFYRPSDDMLGRTLHEILPKEQADYNLSMIRAAIQTGKTVNGEYALQMVGGERWFSTSISGLSETTAVFVAHDITRRKRDDLVQDAIFRITRASITAGNVDDLYRSIHSILGELIPAENFYIALFDPLKGLMTFPYYVDQFDESPSAPTPVQGLTGYVIRTGLPLLAPQEIFEQLLKRGEVDEVGTAGVDWMGAPLKVEGRTIGVMVVQSYTEGIRFNQTDLNLLEFVSTQAAQAIQRKRLEEEIVNLSLSDELTGLYNRRGFNLMAEQEMKRVRRYKRSVLLYFCDVDNLKLINDTHGHDQGDLALKEISAILKETFRETDIPARFGGDEFVVLMVDADLESVEPLTNRLQSRLEKVNQGENRLYPLSLSIGIACCDPDAPCTLNELIVRADGLMYEQKRTRKEHRQLLS